ncbi:MAG: hypothetical protein M1348_03070 [Candidatus Parvarchaeota archaeon]|nr:hypothetical protein [Candidatus Parvarchaeota archaeon]
MIRDRLLSTIDKSSDVRVRVVGKVTALDEKIGTFVLSDGASRVTCLPPLNKSYLPQTDELVTLVGRVAYADNDEVEIRTDFLEKISQKDYDSYNKYLKIRGNLLHDGSGV